jgi:hypothetical protein
MIDKKYSKSVYVLACMIVVLSMNVQDVIGQTCQAEQNIDYYGNDIGAGRPVSSFDSCCLLCNAETNCYSFTYIPANNNCFLKNQLGANRINSPGRMLSFYLLLSFF